MADIDFEILGNGNMRITADEEARAELQDAYDDGGYPKALNLLFERALDSGYESVLPEAIGALTSSPILGEDVTYGEEGEQVVGGRVWWFPNYQVIDEVKTLIDTGEVTFALGEALEPEDQNPAP